MTRLRETHGRPDRGHAWRARHLAAAIITPVVLAGCAPAYVPALSSSPGLLAPADSGTLAYETGRRDALRVSGRSWVGELSLVGLTIGVLGARSTNELWVLPATMVTVSGGAALWAYRETRRPVPLPPDSMRARYALHDGVLWTRYQQGFHDEIVQQRRAHFVTRARSAVMTAVLYGVLYWPLFRD
jgi:hypothetical protein